MMYINGISKMLLLVFLLLPLVSTTDYYLRIDENTSINQSIYQFSRSYELLNNFQSNFNLTNENQSLILTKLIDRDAWCSSNICSCEDCSLILELFAHDEQTSLPIFSTINITILDLNDHSCQFLDIQTNISLSESIQIGHRFPIARAIDADSGINGQLSFQLLENPSFFDLNIIKLSSNEYGIYGIVKRAFDRELTERYDLIIEARDHAIEHVRTNRTQVTIWILDENDNAPKFNQTEYSIPSLPEDTPIGAELLTIIATDADKGLNSLIHYSIVHPVDVPFVINPSTGIVSLRETLDYETIRSYRFLIRASDSGLPQSLYTDTWLSISIKDVNDCPVDILFTPNRRFRYENSILFIYENTEINNLTLGYIRLSDRDSIPAKLSVSLSILDPNPQQDYQLNSNVLIVTQGIFDREIQSEMNLQLIASDTQLTSNFHLKIHLIDLNDNPSEFPSNPMRYSIEELANYQMIEHPIINDQLTIGYLNTTDRDEGENTVNRYELETNAFVRVDTNTGRLFLIQPLDRERISKIELKAKAINIAEPKWETEVQIIIDVLDVNDHIPQCVSPFSRLIIPEDFPIDQSIIKINGTDADDGLNAKIIYSFRENSSWPFEINSQTGEISSKKPFDYESEWKKFFFTIDLEDHGKNVHSNACQIEIILQDINDHSPELIDPIQTRIFLDLQKPFEQQMIALNATDADSDDNGRIKYSLVNQRMDSLFILYENGSLQLTRPITQIDLFTLTVQLEDYGQPIRRTRVEVIVAIGDSSIPSFSTFEKVQLKYSQPRSIGLILGLIVLTITVILFLCLLFTWILLRKHRRNHQAAIIARKQLLCSSSQQLTSSGSTTTTTSVEHAPIAHIVPIKPHYWDEKLYDQRSSYTYNTDSTTPESRTYKILHIPRENAYYMNYFHQEKVDNHSSDLGYQGSYETGSSTSSSSQLSIRRSYLVNQLPEFVTKCKTVNGGFLVEMNVDGSDEERK